MVLRRVTASRREALYGAEPTRRIELTAAAELPAHTLIARAGAAVAKMARALQPHAECVWVACGPGNNGGDGLVAATLLHRWHQAQGNATQVVVTHVLGSPPEGSDLPPDARHALAQAVQAGVPFSTTPPERWDLAIDALLGVGLSRPPDGMLADWIARMNRSGETLLCVDVPSGLNADTGTWPQSLACELTACEHASQRHTLSLLTLKPGLFTAAGRDAAGEVWIDDLEVIPAIEIPVTGWLAGRQSPDCTSQSPDCTSPSLRHASHKGSRGDVVVIGGQDLELAGLGMTGAALLAARAALHGGAGRVFVSLLAAAEDAEAVRWDPGCPDLMFRRLSTLLQGALLQTSAVVCGCGGGAAIAHVMPQLLSRAPNLVLDADALNAVARDKDLQKLVRQRRSSGWITVLTPHPLEAARLLNSTTATVMADRLQAAQDLADHYGSVCVLKGSGSVISAPGQAPLINPTGNPLLATAGTGDVLAGMIGSALAQPGCTPAQAQERVARAVFQHGWLADQWQTQGARGPAAAPALSASRLAERVRPTA